MAHGTAPRKVAGVWVTRSGRRLSKAGQTYWDRAHAEGRTDGNGHMVKAGVGGEASAKAKPTPAKPTKSDPLGFHDKAKANQKAGKHSSFLGGITSAAKTVGKVAYAGTPGPVIESAVRHPSLKSVGRAVVDANPVFGQNFEAGLDTAKAARGTAKRAAGGKAPSVAEALALASVIPVGGRGAKALKAVVDVEHAAQKAPSAARAARRTLTVNEKTQQLPRARSKITQTFIENPADRFSTRHPNLPIAGATERVAKHAGRETMMEGHRATANVQRHLNALPKEGSPEDVAHFWYAQLPKTHRNPEGLQAVRAKQAAELERIVNGSALAALQKRGAKIAIADLPHKQHDLSVSIAQLDQAIKAAPKADDKIIGAVHALSGDRQSVLEGAGLLDAHRATERRGIVSKWIGQNPTGEEAFIGHRLDRVRGANEPVLPKSAGTGRARQPEGLHKQNKLVRASTGRVRMSTRVAAEDWAAAQTYRSAVRARDDLGKIGKPFTGRIGENEMLVNPKGRAVPKEWKTDKLAKLAEQGYDENEIRNAADEITKGFLADKAGADDLLAQAAEHGVHWDELRVVPKRVVERYYGQFTSARSASIGGRLYDKAVDATAASIIFARLGYIPKNVAQNLIMSVPHQGAYFLANAPRAGQVLRDEKLRHLIGGEVGTGATGALGQEFTSKLGGLPSKLTNAVSGVADTPARISAFLHEAAAEGIISRISPTLTEKEKEALVDLLTNPAKREQLNDIRSRSVEAMADFSRMTPKQRKWSRRFLIIPGWLWAGSRYPAHFAATHPIRSGAMAYIAAGEPGAPDELQVNKPINEYFAKGLPPWMQGVDTGGGKVLPTTSLSPVGTPIDIASAIVGRDGATVGDFTNPLAAAGWNIAHSEVSGPHGSYKTSMKKSLLGNLERLAPTEKFARALIDPPDDPTTYAEDSSRLGRLKRELGVVPIKINRTLPAAEEDAAETRDLVKKLGLGKDLPAPVKKSYARLAERENAWKKATDGKKSGTRDYYVAKYKADLELAQKWGYLKPAQVAKAHEWMKHAPYDDIKKAHAALSDEGGIYDKELAPARETKRWLEAQDKYASDLDNAVNKGILTKQQAARAKAWARKADNSDIDKARVALERKEPALVG